MQQGRYGGSVQYIDIFRQGVAAVRHGLDRNAVAAQGSHSLPDGGAAHAQPSGQLLTGDILSPCAVQRCENFLFDHAAAPLSGPTVSQYTAAGAEMSTPSRLHG